MERRSRATLPRWTLLGPVPLLLVERIDDLRRCGEDGRCTSLLFLFFLLCILRGGRIGA